MSAGDGKKCSRSADRLREAVCKSSLLELYARVVCCSCIRSCLFLCVELLYPLSEKYQEKVLSDKVLTIRLLSLDIILLFYEIIII